MCILKIINKLTLALIILCLYQTAYANLSNYPQVEVPSSANYTGWMGSSGYMCPDSPFRQNAITPGTQPLRFTDHTTYLCSYNGNTSGNFVPKTASYILRLYMCAAGETPPGCPYSDSPARAISSKTDMAGQNIDFDGPRTQGGGSLDTQVRSGCYSLRNPAGTEYSISLGITPGCPNSQPLPDHPIVCTFNAGASTLNIDMGILTRSALSVTPGNTTPVTKAIDIDCDSDASVNYTVSFQFTSIPGDGNQYIATSLKGLAVAFSVDGNLVNPSATMTKSYTPGQNTMTLSFEALRDKAVNVGDMETGDFSASAVMILTEQ